MALAEFDQALPSRSDWLGWAFLPLKRYAQFNGRSGRREFWWYSLFLALGYIVPPILLSLLVGMLSGGSGGFGVAALSVWWLLFFLVNFIPGLAVSVRRLHDLGLSGWLLLAAYAAMLFLSVLGWIGYLVVMALPGQARENQYGPVPGEDQLPDIFA